MRLVLRVWRQPGPDATGRFVDHEVDDAVEDMSLLELLDRVNDDLVVRGEPPIAFDSDCREGICGACGIMVDGHAHGPRPNTPSCHQHLRDFADGDLVTLEPMRVGAFPVVRDLVVDRSALDRVVLAGGFVSVDAGTAPDADVLAVTHADGEAALDMAACIGCGACVAACPNGAAHLFAGAKLAHLALQPRGRMERARRARGIVDRLDQDFGPCSTHGECEPACPADIPLTAVAHVNRERLRAWWSGRDD